MQRAISFRASLHVLSYVLPQSPPHDHMLFFSPGELTGSDDADVRRKKRWICGEKSAPGWLERVYIWSILRGLLEKYWSQWGRVRLWSSPRSWFPTSLSVISHPDPPSFPSSSSFCLFPFIPHLFLLNSLLCSWFIVRFLLFLSSGWIKLDLASSD